MRPFCQKRSMLSQKVFHENYFQKMLLLLTEYQRSYERSKIESFVCISHWKPGWPRFGAFSKLQMLISCQGFITFITTSHILSKSSSSIISKAFRPQNINFSTFMQISSSHYESRVWNETIPTTWKITIQYHLFRAALSQTIAFEKT